MKYLPSLIVLLVTLLATVFSLQSNDGHLTYAIDDAYIHLDLADQLWRTGVYGVNEGQYSAPSSSILWPELLFIGAGTPWHEYVPYALNLLAGLASGLLLFSIFLSVSKQAWVAAALGSIAVLALNIPGLTLCGMEHNLQTLLTLLAVYGLIESEQKGAIPRWLWLVLLLGPLVRYENALVSFAVLAMLLHRGHWRPALLYGSLIALALGGFSLFLLAHDLGAFPTSIMVKKAPGDANYWNLVLTNIGYSLRSPIACTLTLLAFLATIWCLLRLEFKNQRWFATLVLAGAIFAHLLVGRYSIWDMPRYEIYLMAFVLPYGLWLWRTELGRSKMAIAALLLCIPPLAIEGSLNSLFTATNQTRATFLQHRQLANLAHNFWQKPIAVNDIGMVGYRNPALVLDLVGLSERRTLTALAALKHDPLALDKLVRSEPVDLIAVYRNWYSSESRQNWQPLGEVFREGGLTTLGADAVLFLTPYPEKAAPLQAVLREWASTLPAGAAYVEYNETNPTPGGYAIPGWPAHFINRDNHAR